ncbi:MAG: hypothetical protein ACTHN5_16040, partial [Phycisphaerae bacterium]
RGRRPRRAPPPPPPPWPPACPRAGRGPPRAGGLAGYFPGPDGGKPEHGVPELSGCVAIAGAKAGASVLAVHPGAKVNGAPAIVLAVEQYGKGRSAAFAADTTWHWNLFLRGMGKDSPYNRFWGQMVRWLASEEDLQKKNGPSVVAMLGKEKYEAGEKVVLRAAVTDREGQSTNYANVWAEVTGPDGKVSRVAMAAQQAEGSVGEYAGTVEPGMSGKYGVVVRGEKEKVDLGKDTTNFEVLAAAGERDVLAAEPGTLREISRLTGGNYVELPGVGALADRLVAELPAGAVAVKTAVPLYHPRGFFFVVIGCLGVEWFLRRKWQLQ